MSSRPIEFWVKNEKLTGTLFFPSDLKATNPAVIFIHGWNSNESGYAARAEPLLKLGYVCLSFNLRGHGSSSGSIKKVTLQQGIDDSIAAYDFLASQKEVAKGKIHVVGTSYGGYLAAMLSSKRKVKSLVLRVPAIYRDEDLTAAKASMDIISLFDRYGTKDLEIANNLALRAISEFKGRILLIEAENDTIIPHHIIESIKRVAKSSLIKYELVKGADHPFSKEIWQAEFRRLLADWFEREL